MIKKNQRKSLMKGERRAKIDKNAAFLEFKQLEEAKQLEASIMQIRQEMLINKDELKHKTE